jgi:hypothetical protein
MAKPAVLYCRQAAVISSKRVSSIQGLLLNDATLNVETFQVFAYSFHVYKALTYEYKAASLLTG